MRSGWQGQPFAWLGNTDLSDNLWGDGADATRLPNTSHGLNEFQHLHRAALLTALNPPPAHYSFLDAQGIDGEVAKTAIHRQAIYQAACRISLRNPDDATPKEVIVPDRATALWLAEKFPGLRGRRARRDAAGAEVQGRGPRLHESDAARKPRSRRGGGKKFARPPAVNQARPARLRPRRLQQWRSSTPAGQGEGW